VCCGLARWRRDGGRAAFESIRPRDAHTTTTRRTNTKTTQPPPRRFHLAQIAEINPKVACISSKLHLEVRPTHTPPYHFPTFPFSRFSVTVSRFIWSPGFPSLSPSLEVRVFHTFARDSGRIDNEKAYARAAD
jgi:hypothetical protein